MGTFFTYFAILAILCSTASAQPKPSGTASAQPKPSGTASAQPKPSGSHSNANKIWEKAKSYVTSICTKFARKFETIKVNDHAGNLRTQFSVVTLNQIDPEKVNSGITRDEEEQLRNRNFISGSRWIATYIGNTYTILDQEVHLEDKLLEHLPSILKTFVRKEKKLPSNIYLYTYLIPCPDCAMIIDDAVKNKIPTLIDEYIQNKYISKLTADEQLKAMTFWVLWTNTTQKRKQDVKSGDQESDYDKTRRLFKELEDAQKSSVGPKFETGYLPETRNPEACRIS